MAPDKPLDTALVWFRRDLRADDHAALYHALCVLAGNGSTLLWQKLFHDFESRLGIPPQVAFPYLQQVAGNLQHGPGHALTGPLDRGDTATVQANLAALDGDPFHAVYTALVRAHALGA